MPPLPHRTGNTGQGGQLRIEASFSLAGVNFCKTPADEKSLASLERSFVNFLSPKAQCCSGSGEARDPWAGENNQVRTGGGVSAVSPGRVSSLLAQLQLGDQELGDPTPFKEAQGGLPSWLLRAFFWIPGDFRSLGPLTSWDLPTALAGGTSHKAGTGSSFTRHAGTERLAASDAGVAGSFVANGWAGGQDRFVLILPRTQLGECLTHHSGGVFTNKKRTEFTAKLVSTDTGCNSGFGFSGLARTAITMSASSSPRKLGDGKLSSYMGLSHQKSQCVSFHYCRGAQSACKRDEKSRSYFTRRDFQK